MTDYVRYRDDLETVPDNEDAQIDDIVRYLRITQKRTFDERRHATRDTHAKGQGFLKGTFTIEPDLPEELAQSLFATPGHHDAVLRFATEPGAMLDDRVPAARGLGLKVFDIDGDKMAGDGRRTQDFTFNNCPILPLTDVPTYREIHYLKAEYGHDPDLLAAKIGERDDADLQTLFERLPNIDLLANSYYSQSAFRFGDYVCKYALMPNREAQRALAARPVTDDDSPGVLTEWLTDFMADNEAGFDFCIQLQTDTTRMPIEDASVDWPVGESAYRKVATLTLPPQNPYTPARRVFCDDVLGFDGWLGRADLRPLGSINRVRAKAYRASSAMRHHLNQRAEFEPASIADVPD
ncbi:catalase family protein [uncultured Salinisphaera sp.]|uniref:catalase family protein n=1 Tax=uncultured Salinisphaera sp. TaxID=359372 RepID=UPI0032B29C5D|tara:strand:+ start:6412 stop:7464 length:1053 start_codon:yes stop_codon:yes gene_type:complete